MKSLLSGLLPQDIKNLYHKYRAAKACERYNFPSTKLKIIGITGTDGKTSTSTMMYEILKAAGKKVGLITTISAKIGENEYPTGFHVTSPDPEDLQKFLKDMVDAGLEYVVLETTSHGLYQHRVYGVEYIAAIYTNITHEHLDHHKTYENYVKAKSLLMKQTNKETGFAVINHDDISYKHLINYVEEYKIKQYTYGAENNSDIYFSNVNENDEGSEFKINSKETSFTVKLNLPGRYNIFNATAAITAALKIGIDPESIANGLAKIQNIEGRWQVIQKEPFKVVVDFAHTPNALKNVLQYAKTDNKTGKVIAVFGSAGKRDVTKRPLMGESAGSFADITILTAEDPRGESVTAISEMIAQGLKSKDKVENKDYYIVEDRKEAINKALTIAQPGDTIVICGKGHEQSMNLDGLTEIEWSDKLVTQELLKEIKGAQK